MTPGNIPCPFVDDDLAIFERDGTPPLPAPDRTGHVRHDGADIWFASFGSGRPVVLLHGGLGHSGNWAHQVPALLAAGHRAIVIDSRGHGRSTRDSQPYSYVQMGEDVLAVMDDLRLDRAAFVGWSDGACTALSLGDRHPDRVDGVLYFACNMDAEGALPFTPTPVIERCFARHKRDYVALSATPHDFDAFVEAVGLMQRTQPDYTAGQLAAVTVPVRILHSAGDEFIRAEHAAYLAHAIPGAELTTMQGVTHFAPLQRPAVFNQVVLDWLQSLRR